MPKTPMPSVDQESFPVSICVALAGFVRLVILWLGSDARLSMTIPDDAFYYLVPAKYFATLGRWTFDGVEPSSGFHLLWGYFLAFIYKLRPNTSLHAMFAIAGSIQVLALAFAAYLLTRVAVRLFGPGAGWGVATVFLSATVLCQAGWLMESAFVIVLTAAVVQVLGASGRRLTVRTVLGCILLGWLLELARSDSGLLVGFLFLMELVLWKRKQTAASMLLLAGSILAGAVLGLATVLIHTHAVSGRWIQASAQQKLFWSQITGKNSIRSVLGTPMSVLQPLHNAVPHYSTHIFFARVVGVAGHVLGFAILFAVLLGAAIKLKRSATLAQAFIATLLTLTLAYAFFYRNDGGIFDWYIANFVGCMALLTAASTAWFTAQSPKVAKSIVIVMCLAGFFCSLVPTFPWQEVMYRAGVYLRDGTWDGRQGAFNSGIVAFFAQHPVTNLDGLINDSILPHAKDGTLATYMAQRDVIYLFDSPHMLQDTDLQRRGGYADGRLIRCQVRATDVFPNDPYNVWEGQHIILYRFNRECLRGGE